MEEQRLPALPALPRPVDAAPHGEVGGDAGNRVGLRAQGLLGPGVPRGLLRIYLLNLLIGFLSPVFDPELEGMGGASLPTRGSDEFKPFVRRLPEFKFWYSITKAFCVAFVMTFFSVFDVPVFWPMLLFCWVVLLFLTMKRQIQHMIKYKYVPFSRWPT